MLIVLLTVSHCPVAMILFNVSSSLGTISVFRRLRVRVPQLPLILGSLGLSHGSF